MAWEFGRGIIFRRLTWTLRIFFRFFIDFITCRTLGTLRVELPVGNNNGTTFKHTSKKGNGRGTRWGRYISWRVSTVVSFPVALGLNEKSVLFLVYRSLGWYESTEILSPTNAACTIYSNVLLHMLVSYSPPRTVDEGERATFFYRT